MCLITQYSNISLKIPSTTLKLRCATTEGGWEQIGESTYYFSCCSDKILENNNLRREDLFGSHLECAAHRVGRGLRQLAPLHLQGAEKDGYWWSDRLWMQSLISATHSWGLFLPYLTQHRNSLIDRPCSLYPRRLRSRSCQVDNQINQHREENG